MKLISQLSSEDLVKVAERLEISAKEVASCFDKLATIVTANAEISSVVRQNLPVISDAISAINSAKELVEQEIKESHTISDNEYDLLADG